MRTMFQPLFAATISVALFGTTEAVSAQQAAAPTTTRSYVQVVRLHADMVDEWMALQKNEVIPAQKKAGVTGRITLATQVGNAFEYTTITPFPSWAAMDGDAPLVRALGAAGAAALNGKLRKCIMTQSSYMSTRQDDLSIPGGDALVWRVVVRRLLPGKMQDYLTFYKAEVLPAMQRAKAEGKIAGSTVAMRGVGAPSGEFATITLYNKFADLASGNPVALVLGQEAAAKIGDKANLLSTTGQTIVRRRVADLSF